MSATTDSSGPTIVSITTAGGIGVAKSANIGGDVKVGTVALTTGGLELSTFELQNVTASADATIFSGLLGASGDYNAFTLSILVRRTDDETINQRDLLWITSQGTDSSIKEILTQPGTTGGIPYTLSFSGSDLVFSHTETGKTVDVVVGVSGLQGVAP